MGQRVNYQVETDHVLTYFLYLDRNRMMDCLSLTVQTGRT
jgi:hypothetical protein